MIKNIGIYDRIGRITFGVAVLTLYLTGTIGGGWAIALGAVGAILVATGLMGTCPIYLMLRISSAKKKENMCHVRYN